jgi:hypothetical protein
LIRVIQNVSAGLNFVENMNGGCQFWEMAYTQLQRQQENEILRNNVWKRESCSTGSTSRQMEGAFTNSAMNVPSHKSKKFIENRGKYCHFRKNLCQGPVNYYTENLVWRSKTRARAVVCRT